MAKSSTQIETTLIFPAVTGKDDKLLSWEFVISFLKKDDINADHSERIRIPVSIIPESSDAYRLKTTLDAILIAFENGYIKFDKK